MDDFSRVTMILYVLIVSFTLMGLLLTLMHVLSRREVSKEAREALWRGFAQFNADNPGTDPRARLALSSVGSFLGLKSQLRAAGGNLLIYPQKIEWHPSRWHVMRGNPQPIYVERWEVIAFSIRRRHPVAIKGFDVNLVTINGDIRFLVTSREEFINAVSALGIPQIDAR